MGLEPRVADFQERPNFKEGFFQYIPSPEKKNEKWQKLKKNVKEMAENRDKIKK